MTDVRTAVRAEPDAETYRTVRRTWIAHSIAEDNRDIPGLIATLVPDCVYEMPQTGRRWEGHEGARRFYSHSSVCSAFLRYHRSCNRTLQGIPP